MQVEVAILGAVALIIGVPSIWRNPTSFALVIAWAVSSGIYLVTGRSVAPEYYLFPDVFTVAIIMAKREHCNLRPYRNAFHQLKCALLERSPADRFILLSFPAVWWLYVFPPSYEHQYWGLWSIAIAQFLAAGWEAFSLFIRRRYAEAVSVQPCSRNGMEAAVG